MSKKIKILLGSIALALGFFFCFCMVSVNAEEVQPTTDEQQEVVENTEQQETEQPTEEEQEEVKQDENLANAVLDFIGKLDVETIKGWFYGLCAALGIDFTFIAILVVCLLKNKAKQFTESEMWKNIKAQADAKHQQEMEELAKKQNQLLEDLKNTLVDQLKSLDDEKKKVAQNNIAVLKENLNTIKEDLDK